MRMEVRRLSSDSVDPKGGLNPNFCIRLLLAMFAI